MHAHIHKCLSVLLTSMRYCRKWSGTRVECRLRQVQLLLRGLRPATLVGCGCCFTGSQVFDYWDEAFYSLNTSLNCESACMYSVPVDLHLCVYACVRSFQLPLVSIPPLHRRKLLTPSYQQVCTRWSVCAEFWVLSYCRLRLSVCVNERL